MPSWASIVREGKKQCDKDPNQDLKSNCPFKIDQYYHLEEFNCTWKFVGIDFYFKKYMWDGGSHLENGRIISTIYYTYPSDHIDIKIN